MGPGAEAPLGAWIRYARGLAIFTIGFNLLEGLASLAFGWSEGSTALAGFGADSLIEVLSAALVLWRLRGGPADRERAAVKGIGTLLLALGLGIPGSALLQLAGGRHPGTTLPGALISLISMGAMLLLWRGKQAAARALDSRALAGDAACSLACVQLSAVLMAGSLLNLALPGLAWADGAAAALLALFIAKEGWSMRRAASRKDFDGGCGCH